MKPYKTIKFTSVIILLLIGSVISDCGKKVQNVNKDFIGNWTHTYSGGMRFESLIITDDRESEAKTCSQNIGGMYCTNGTCYECEFNGTGRARIKDNVLHIGGARYKINTPPTKGSLGTYMILDGKTFSRIGSDESCYDGIKNQNETGLDCGGVCATCGTCTDGIRNQDETSIDCGGNSCGSCFDSFNYSITNPATNVTTTYHANVVDASYSSGYFKFKIDFDSGNQYVYVEFEAHNTGTFSYQNVSYVNPGDSLGDYYIEPTVGMKVTVSSVNFGTNRISGTFSFKGRNFSAVSPVSDVCIVSGGSFTNLKFYNN